MAPKGRRGKRTAKPAARSAAPSSRHIANLRPSPESIRLTRAFTASADLRPMAQQLAVTRSPDAYAGVQSFARTHPGEAASAAWLAIGHSYSLDRRYADAASAFHTAATTGDALSDYADYLGAQADVQPGHGADAYPLLEHFAQHHPDSIFAVSAPVALANAHLQQADAAGALRILTALVDTPEAAHADFRYALGRAYAGTSDNTHAAQTFRALYLALPFSPEAGQARQQLQNIGSPLSAADRKSHADQIFNAKRFAEAGAEYHAIEANDAGLSQSDRDVLKIHAAVCDLKLKHISRRQVEHLPDTSDDSAAIKLYMLAELSRSEDNRSEHDAIIAQMVQRFPHSRWLEEALYSGGNMYLLKHDPTQTTYHYQLLVKLFPESTYAPSAHWRAAWMNYRLRHYDVAAQMMDEQIERYPAGIEAPSALYWRARIFEEEEKNLPQAVNYYRSLSANYVNFYYGALARERLAVLSNQPEIPPSPVLSSVRKPVIPELIATLPENEPHLIKARLLANAALNEYIAPEIQASPTSPQWGVLAQAEIYSSFGEQTRALQSIKRSGISFFSIPFDQVPTVYWRLLFPSPWWTDIVSNSSRNGLDPNLVASLIRQESEFNPSVVSRANAYGLMQLLPSVGKSMAKKQGIKGFNANQLLNPALNIQLGTANLREVLDRFNGRPEYALAAYNAGDVPVRQWMSNGEYKDVPEFVESIPYTETREYVQAILRNRELYRALNNPH